MRIAVRHSRMHDSGGRILGRVPCTANGCGCAAIRSGRRDLDCQGCEVYRKSRRSAIGENEAFVTVLGRDEMQLALLTVLNA